MVIASVLLETHFGPTSGVAGSATPGRCCGGHSHLRRHLHLLGGPVDSTLGTSGFSAAFTAAAAVAFTAAAAVALATAALGATIARHRH